jgi:hypothetical protein
MAVLGTHRTRPNPRVKCASVVPGEARTRSPAPLPCWIDVQVVPAQSNKSTRAKTRSQRLPFVPPRVAEVPSLSTARKAGGLDH